MPAFITQTVDEQPSWLVVCSNPNHPLASAVVTLLRQNGFEVETTTQVPGETSKFYKTILIFTDSTLINVDRLSLPHPDSVLVLTTISNGEQENQAKLQQLASFYPNFSWCVGVDVVTDSPSLGWQTTLLSQVAQQKLLDPSLTLTPQTTAAFVQRSGELLLAPWRGQKWLVEGKKTTSNQVVLGLKNLALRVFGTEFELNASIINNNTPFSWSDEWQFKTHQAEPQSFLDVMLSWLQSKKPQVPLAERRPVQATTPIPEVKTPTPLEQPRPTPPKTTQPQAEKKPFHAPKPTLIPSPTHASSQASQTQILKELQQLFESTHVEQKVERVKKAALTSHNIHYHQKKRRAAFYVGTVISGVGLGLISLMVLLIASTWMLRRQLLGVTQNLGQNTTKTFQERSRALQAWTTLVQAQLTTYQLVFSEDFFAQPLVLVEVAEQLIEVGDLVQSSRSLSQQAVRQMLGSESGDALATLDASAVAAGRAYQQLSLLNAVLDHWRALQLPDDQLQQIESFVDSVSAERRALTTAQQLQPLLPKLLGVSGRRRYAVLLTDNQELTPGGGVVSAVALVTFDQGLLVDTDTYSINQLNSKLDGEVVVPVELKTQLGQNPYQVQDTTLFSEFSTTGDQTRWFVEKTLGVTVDGVVSIDIAGLSQLIAALGPVELSGYNETLTDHNLADRVAFHSEVPLANQDQGSYTSELLSVVLTALRLAPADSVSGVLSALNQNLQQQHMLVSLTDSAEAASFENLGWTGAVLQPSCPTQLTQESRGTCQVDAVYQVETNLGANKANHYLDHTITHTVLFSETQAQHTRDIVWSNTASSNAWPKGQYTAYLQVVLPDGANTPSITINNQPVPLSQLQLSTLRGRQVLSTKITVPIQTTTHAQLQFSTPLPDGSEFSYVMFDQKQPGTESDPTTIVFEFNNAFSAPVIAPQATVLDNSIAFNDFKTKHLFVGAVFKKR